MSAFLMKSAMAAAAALAVSGCSTYGDYGPGRYGDRYVGQQRSYYGWSGNYYYPGTGYYVYDRAGSRYRWNDSQRRYWEARRPSHRARDNWDGYRGDRREWREDRRDDRREWRGERRDDRRDWRDDRRDRRDGRRGRPD